MTVGKPKSYGVRNIWNESRQIFADGSRRSTAWMHPLAAFAAFTTDFIKPLFAYTVWFLILGLGTACIFAVLRRRWLTTELARRRGAAAIVFSVVFALLSMVVLGAEYLEGDPPEGVFAKEIPFLLQAQRDLTVALARNTTAVDANTAQLEKLIAALTAQGKNPVWRVDLPHPCTGKRLCIVVAGLDGPGLDENEAYRQTNYVLEALRDAFLLDEAEEPPAQILFVPRQLREPQGGDLKQNALAIETIGRRWMTKLNGDVFIYGKVILSDKVIRLHLLSGAVRTGRRYVLNDEAVLLNFDTDMSAALASFAITGAAPANNPGDFVVSKLRPLERKLRTLLTQPPRGLTGSKLADIYRSYGLVALAIGQLSQPDPYLKEALWAYEQSSNLEPSKQSENWARSEMGRGNTLKALGDREETTQNLEGALAAYKNAQRIFETLNIRARVLDVEDNISNVLEALAERTKIKERRIALYKEIISTRRNILNNFDRTDAVGRAWARYNYGTTISILGQETGDQRTLAQAAAELEAVAREFGKARPRDMADLQSNLGVTYTSLGEFEKALAVLRPAAKAYIAHRAWPDLALTDINIGDALLGMGKRDGSAAELKAAREAYRSARDGLSDDPYHRSMAMRQIAITDALIAKIPAKNSR